MFEFKNEETGVMKNFKHGFKHIYDAYAGLVTNDFEYLENIKINGHKGKKFVAKHSTEEVTVNSYNAFSFISAVKTGRDLEAYLQVVNYNQEYFEKIKKSLSEGNIHANYRLYLAGIFTKLIHHRVQKNIPVKTEEKRLANETFKQFENEPVFQKGLMFTQKVMQRRKIKNKAGRHTDLKIIDLQFKLRKVVNWTDTEGRIYL